MKYIVVEIQTAANGTVATIVNDYEDRNAAEARFHAVLAAAAASSLKTHAAIMFSNEGFPIRYESYTHEAEETES